MDNYTWLIFDDEQACKDRLRKASNDLPPTLSGTNEYGYYIQHKEKNLFAFPISKDFLYLFTENEIKEAVELSDDWHIVNIDEL